MRTTTQSPPAPGRPSARLSRVPSAAIWAVALASGGGAIAAGARPTANSISDIVVCAVIGVGVVLASSFSRPRAWIAASLIALATASGAWIAIAGAATALSVITTRRAGPLEGRLAGALIGAAVVQTLLRQPPDRFLLNATAALLAVGCLIITAWPTIGDRARARLRTLALIVGGATAIAVSGMVLSVLLSRHALQGGIRQANEGLEAVRVGESSHAADLLDSASGSFRAAHQNFSAWYSKPARLLPGIGQQSRALEVLTQEGFHLAAETATSTRATQVEDLRITQGRVDLDRVRAMAGPLAAIQGALARANDRTRRAESPWLLAPVAGRLASFQRSITRATEDAQTAAAAVEVIPDLLGGNGPRRYFVAFATPAETRDLGGFMGAYALLVVDNGDITLQRTGRVNDLNERFQGRQLTDPSVFPNGFLALRPEQYWQNITGSADFPTTAEAARQMWRPPALPLDGVLYMDPQALADMLQLTGPITLPGYPRPLTALTAAPFLLRNQYTTFPDDQALVDSAEIRHDFLVDAAQTVFLKMTSGDLPGPRQLADTMAPAVQARRLLFHSFHPDEQALIERMHFDGALPPVDGDFLSVRASNRGRSKIDAFMHRTVAYDVAVDPDHDTVRSTVTVTIRNDAPASGLPDPVIGNRLKFPPGTNSTTVAVYTPLDLVDVRMDGESINRGAAPEYDRNRYWALLDIPPGATQTVTFTLEGTIDLQRGYHLDVVPQPMVNNDRFRVNVEGPKGWTGYGRATLTRQLEQDTALNVFFLPPR